MLMIEKSYDLVGYDRGTYCWSVLNAFLNFWKSYIFEYLMKFTDALYEAVLA